MTTEMSTPSTDKALERGRIVVISGPVVDVEFPPHALPEISSALEISGSA